MHCSVRSFQENKKFREALLKSCPFWCSRSLQRQDPGGPSSDLLPATATEDHPTIKERRQDSGGQEPGLATRGSTTPPRILSRSRMGTSRRTLPGEKLPEPSVNGGQIRLKQLIQSFYELSDGGSCSLSASCASVCSDRLSSSLGALLPASPNSRTSTGDCRPWSADETTVCGAPVPSWEPRATEEGSGRRLQATSRPRPVSTGDLDRVLPAEAGPQNASVDPKATSFLCRGMDLPPHRLDPECQRDLECGGGREADPYPSPLHAVAPQTPLFALTRETPKSDGHAPPSKPLPRTSGPSSIRPGPVLEAGPAGAYIDRLLRLRGRGEPPRGSADEQRSSGWEAAPSQGAESNSHPKKLTCAPGADRSAAECASLLHSAVTETSEDEASDYTANRFGDGESSGSDVGAGVGGSGGCPARPRVHPHRPAHAPASARPALPPAPKLYHVKASRALKRKIRRFQPAALKVMTTV
ncbi:Dapper like protein 2 [Pteropus alecto]|uniref:Dapper like protein 2 n=1 Tax=Pteropus alecto TaxID=9402 RepID=L5KEK3_PTEAL|nr:Dapper like protein 2 [Pteropus alecto]